MMSHMFMVILHVDFKPRSLDVLDIFQNSLIKNNNKTNKEDMSSHIAGLSYLM